MMKNVTDVNLESGHVKGTRRRPRLKVSASKPPATPVVTVRLSRQVHEALEQVLRPGERYRILDERTVVTYYRSTP
jgi:hypothetical protein